MERKWWTLLSVSVGTFMLLLDVTIVNVALPKIQTGLHSSFTDLQWVVDAYSLTLAALLLTSGSIADLFGRRLVFVAGLAVFSTSSLLCGVAQSPLMLNLSRGAQGVGGAMMFATSLALLGNAFRGRERGIAFGVWGSVTGAAVSVGPVVGGALTEGLSWRWIFLVNVPIGAIAAVMTLARVDESREPSGARVDLPGVVTFSAALGALVFALIETSRKSWGSPLIVACLTASVVLLAAFVVIEHRSKAPMFDLSLLRLPAFDGASLAAFALSASMFSMFLYITLYLQNILGLSPLGAGLRLLATSGAIFVVSGISGRLTTIVPVRLLIGAGLALVGTALLLQRGVTVHSDWTHLIPGFVVAGIGVGMINPPLASTAIAVAPPRQAGMASGINTTFRQVGIATGIATLGSIFSSHVRNDVVAHLSSVQGVGHAGAMAIAHHVSSGQAGAALTQLPPAVRRTAAELVRSSFISGFNEILLVAAVVAFVGAIGSLLLIRTKDFAAQGEPATAAAAPAAA